MNGYFNGFHQLKLKEITPKISIKKSKMNGGHIIWS